MPRNTPLTSVATVKELLAAAAVRPRRRLGQNFLVDAAVLQAILSIAAPFRGGIILEVGAGLGTLTEALAPASRSVMAVELDPKLARLLTERLRRYKNITVRAADIMILPEAALPSEPYSVIANLPYYITTPFLKRFLMKIGRRPANMALMLQREVAERLTAQPPAMNALAAIAQLQSTVALCRRVPRRAFWPQPAVASAIVTLTNIKPMAEKRLWLIERVFTFPRKTIGAITARLATNQPREIITQSLAARHIDPEARPAALSAETWQDWLNFMFKSPS